MKKSLLLWITLFAIAGSILAACSGTASASLTGTWKLISYGSSTNPTPADPNIETSLIFGSDGKLNGNAGCNSFNGDYKVDGSTATFGPIASTMMACADPIMQQEGAVFNVFTNSAAFKIDGSTLTVTSADGNSVVVFERK
jgi:heat shock protein HslJ